jgi:hypothetical protein
VVIETSAVVQQQGPLAADSVSGRVSYFKGARSISDGRGLGHGAARCSREDYDHEALATSQLRVKSAYVSRSRLRPKTCSVTVFHPAPSSLMVVTCCVV